MKKICGLIFFSLFFLNACKKEIEFRKGNYTLSGNPSYTFDSQNYPVVFDPSSLVLLNFSASYMEFFLRTTNSWGQVSEKSLILAVNHNQVSGTFIPNIGDGFFLEGIIFNENKQKKIQGQMSFETTHETIIIDGPYTYPVTYTVFAQGSFKIEPG